MRAESSPPEKSTSAQRARGAGTPWLDWPSVRPFYAEEDIQALVDRGFMRLEGNQAFLLERWGYRGQEERTFNAIMSALQTLQWQVEAKSPVPKLVAAAEARLMLPKAQAGGTIYAEFHMSRRLDDRLADVSAMAIHMVTGQPFLHIPKSFDQGGVDPETRHRWDFFVHGRKETFEASLKGLAPEVARLLAQREAGPGTATFEPRKVPMHMDRPAREDRLGRRAFAVALAKRFRRIVPEPESEAPAVRHFDSAFMVHLHAPWGAGKTSVLHLIAAELTDPSRSVPPWVIVNFNAWQHQRIDPPWWSLLDTVFRESVRSFKHRPLRAAWIRVAEQWRRLSAGRAATLLAIAIAFWITALALYFGWPPDLTSLWTQAGGWAQNATAIAALVAGLWAAVLGFSRSLLPGSAESAQGFVRNTNDPMQSVSVHFRKLVDSLHQPVMVLIDDVDRCDREFVVRLLEGIQTLFHHPRVIFLVAGDRRWINACYESVYSHFVGSIAEPGRRLGALFLEKAFQLSVSLPQPSPKRQEEYWNFLLKTVPEGVEAEREAAHTKARELVGAAKDEQDVLNQLSTGDESLLLSQAIREEMVKRLADEEVEETTHHFLQRFVPLLEPNPRAMKRLLNAYSVYRDIAILSHLDFESTEEGRKKLALWTIVSLRWPLLAEFLVSHADVADVLANPPADPNELVKVVRSRVSVDPANADDARLLDLMKTPMVLKVFDARAVDAKLDADAVRRLSALSSAAGS